MTRSIFGHKSITHLIYGLLMMLPFLAIGVKCIYVQANPNSKDSYYGETINQQENVYLTSNENYNSTTKYYLNCNQGYTYPTTGVQGNLYVSNFKLENVGSLTNTEIENINTYENGIFRLFFTNYNDQNTLQLYYYEDETSHWLLSTNRVFTCSFNYTSSNADVDTYIKTNIYKIQYNNYSYLDNVFDYSISQVIDENNGFVPKNDFVGLLNGVFSDSSDHLYLKLTNWYLNYALLISTIYILFLAMLWFVNLCRNILERSMNIGNGVD